MSDTNLDSQGVNTLLYDYQNGIDPNRIGFSIVSANNYVNNSSAPLQLSIAAGTPFYIAVLVDNTNMSSATWNLYSSSNVAVNLGSTEGWHTVWIGLAGHAANSTQTWQRKRVKLDYTPPTIVITGPSNVISQSIAEITGYSPESLSQISYDMTNTNGVYTNQQLLLLNKTYDTNSWEFTTNTFQAFDVPLAPGTNAITIHATDLAGNSTSTNFTVTLVSDTNPPVVDLTWPQDGTQLSGTNFTIYGTVDDISSSISVSITDSNGDSNLVNATIGRSGKFWIEGLPLTAGTNRLSLNAMDIWGNTFVTNFTVVQSAIGLTIDPVDTSHLYMPTADLTGTVTDPNVSIWANGVKGTNKGDGTWAAKNVPVTSGGNARFTVNAYPGSDSISTNALSPQDNPSDPNSTSTSSDVDKPSRLYIYSYNGSHMDAWNDTVIDSNGDLVKSDDYNRKDSDFWQDNGGGMTKVNQNYSYTLNGSSGTDNCQMNEPWLPTYFPDSEAGTPSSDCADRFIVTAPWNWEHIEATVGASYSLNGGGYSISGSYDTSISGDCVVRLYTGGKGTVSEENLWNVGCPATEHVLIDPSTSYGASVWTNLSVSPERITLGELGTLGHDGIRWLTLPNDVTKTITPKVSGASWYTFNQPGAGKDQLTITANGVNISATTPTFCVGQLITFNAAWDFTPPTSDIVAGWTLPPKYVNESWQAFESPDESTNGFYYGSINYKIDPDLLTNISTSCWYVNKPGGRVSMYQNLHFSNGQYVSVAAHGNINIYRPTLSNFTPLLNGFTWSPITLSGQMSWTVKVNSQYDGLVGITQLINGSGFYYHTDGWELDGNTAIYGDGNNGQPNVYTANNPASQSIGLLDTPSAPATPCCDMIASFEDYVMFQPAGANNIYVTLGIVDWSMNGSACVGTGMTSSNLPPANNPTDSDAFPVWTQNLGE